MTALLLQGYFCIENPPGGNKLLNCGDNYILRKKLLIIFCANFQMKLEEERKRQQQVSAGNGVKVKQEPQDGVEVTGHSGLPPIKIEPGEVMVRLLQSTLRPDQNGSILQMIFTRGIRYCRCLRLSVHVSMCPCINPKLVRTITCQAGITTFGPKCKTQWLSSILF